MSSLYTERAVYLLNVAFVIIMFLVSSNNLFEVSPKATTVKNGWLILAVYFLIISVLFYRSNFLKIRRASIKFKLVTLLPGFFIMPITVICLMYYDQLFDGINYMLCLGGMLWLTAVLLNLFKKNTHAVNSSIF